MAKSERNEANVDRGRAEGRPGRGGRAQLTLVEHALCPLDSATSLAEGLIHRSEFTYVDASRRYRMGVAKVICPLGLSPADEFYLWGLVALTLSQREASTEFYATPHYCLSRLGLIGRGDRAGRGGKNYELFRRAIARLAAVTYMNEQFYDPIRGEHRRVAFGFLSYSLPADPGSSRAWRIVWDPIFLEFCRAARGSLMFDLETYRELDVAGRRLFLLLKKIFWRNASSPAFDARHLGVNVLGFAPSVEMRDLKIKLARCAGKLVERGIVRPAGEGGWYRKKGVGSYEVRFARGPYFDKAPARAVVESIADSPLRDPLLAIGFDESAAARIVAKYRPAVVQVWSDITLAAMERSPGFFKVGPQAYFLDNVEKASRGERTPPDWWYEHRKEEERREREARRGVLELPASDRSAEEEEREFEAFLAGEGRAVFEEIFARLSREFRDEGRPLDESERRAQELARLNLRGRFSTPIKVAGASGPTALGEILDKFRLS